MSQQLSLPAPGPGADQEDASRRHLAAICLRVGYRRPVFRAEGELERRAELFLSEHPDSWINFCRFTFELIRSGADHGGAKAVVERIRWESWTTAHAGDLYAWDNSLTRPIAQAFARAYPEHVDFFRFRVAA